MARRDERGFVFQIRLHHRMAQTNIEQAFQTTSDRVGRWNGLLTSRDNINFVTALNVEIEKLLPDALGNGAVVILFVEPIPKVVILPTLSGSQIGIILWPYYVCGVGWLQRIESRSRKDQRIVNIKANDDGSRRQQSFQLFDGDVPGNRPREGKRGRSDLLGMEQRATAVGR